MKKFRHFVLPNDVTKTIAKLKKFDSNRLEKLGINKAVKLANHTLEITPAYKKFLKLNKISVEKVTSKSFKKLPLVSKKTYLKKAEYKDLFPKKEIKNITTISSTSGSTGEPFYFPRGEEQDQQYEHVAEIFMKMQFEIDKKTSLAINGFGLGIWIGGIYTYKNINKLAQKGYPIAMAPVGTNKEIFLKTLKKQAYLFDQVILMGYPPFIKDILDEAADYGINLKKLDIKILMATEGFSEVFRDYLIQKAGIKNPLKDIVNIYGSVEFGTMSHETALSVLIRRITTQNKDAYKAVFGDAGLLPTLVQYYPHIVYFEQVGSEVIATGMGSSIPLIRYKFHDRGGVVNFDEMISKLKSAGVNILKEAKKAGIEDTITKLPFVFVYERSDFVVVVRGANIYPENIKNALNDFIVEEKVTGRFTMQKFEDEKMDERLGVHVELRKNIKASKKLEKQILDSIVESLRKDNSEYSYLYNLEGKDKLLPKIWLHKFEDTEFFNRNVIKHKWVKK